MFPRESNIPDIGAIEISWVKYDSNGEQWSLPQLSDYDGTFYYEGTTPTAYYQVSYLGHEDTIVNPDNLNTVSRQSFSKRFVEWNTEANGSGTPYLPGDSLILNADVVLYAQWEDNVLEYTVSYNANGGVNEPAAQVVANQEGILISEPGTMSREGYKFLNWNTAQDGSGTAYGPGDSFIVTEDTILYAQWAKIDEKVNLDTDENNRRINGFTLPQTGGYLFYIIGSVVLLSGCIFLLRHSRKN